jgi:hypothetical protein
LGKNAQVGVGAVLECDAPVHVEDGAVVPENYTVRTRATVRGGGEVLMPLWIRSEDSHEAGSLIDSCAGLEPPIE